MTVDKKYLSDIEVILSHEYDNGAELWTTPDKRLIKGTPFSTLESIMYLLELGVDSSDSIIRRTADLIFSTWWMMDVLNYIQRELFIHVRQLMQQSYGLCFR